MTDHSEFSEPDGDLSMRLGHQQIDLEQRWEVVSILNDVMTGLWFLTGSILTLVGDLGDLPIYFFLAGSTQLLARAFLRLARRIHVRGGYQNSRLRMYKPTRDKAS